MAFVGMYIVLVEHVSGNVYKASIRKPEHKDRTPWRAGGTNIVAAGQADDETKAILNAAKQLAGEDTTPWYEDDPGTKTLACKLCGETIIQTDEGFQNLQGQPVEVGEMHGALKPLFGTTDLQTNGGLVHASCGIEAGWEVS